MKLLSLILLFLLFLATVLSHSSSKYKKNNELKAPTFSPKCTACTAAIWSASLFLKPRFTEGAAMKLATVICKIAAKQPWNVCRDLLTSFKHEVLYVIRQIGTRHPSLICGSLLPECADPTDSSGVGWEVTLPPKRNKKKGRRRTNIKGSWSRPLRVLQLADIHIDLHYKEGSEAQCDQPICCQESSNQYINDVLVPPSQPAGYWGTINKCDIPFRTLENMIEYIRENFEIDYIMMSGDYVDHTSWKATKKGHLQVLKKIGDLVKKNFPTIPTYWAIGNHEGVPVNNFAPHSVDKRFWPTWLYSEMANLSQPWIDKEATKTMNYRGSYSVRVMHGLRLISLNTGYCVKTNFFLFINQSDPDKTMSWFVSELYKAELSGEKVHILTHIPPGNEECLEGWARNYYKIIQRFSPTITGQFWGHVHTDSFTVFYQDMKNISSKPIGIGYAAPSVTTFADFNPSFRIYEISTDEKFEVLDFENYFADVNLTNKTHPPQWKLLYKAKEDLKLPDLSPRSWNHYIHRVSTDPNAFEQFLQYSFRADTTSCDLKCQKKLLCSLRMGHHDPDLYCPFSLPSIQKDS